jgi:drug/metabolite transporter (DMT)-like permease
VPSFEAATLIRVAALLVAIIVVVPLLAALGRVSDVWQEVAAPAAWGPVLVAGTIGAGFPAVALVIGYRRVGSVIGAILMIFEPLVGVVLAMLLFGERPTPLQLVGGVLVLAGAALAAMAPRTVTPGARTVTVDPGPFRGE